MRKSKWIQIAVLAAFLFFLYRGSVQNDMIAERFEAEIEACLQEGELPVVVLSQETGAYDYVGQPALWGARYAAEQINRRGGVNGCRVRIVAADTGSEKSRAFSLYKGAARKSCVILGPLDAPETVYISQNTGTEYTAAHIAAYSYEESRQGRAPWAISYMSDSEDGELEAIRVFAAENPDIRDVVLFTTSADESKNSTALLFQEKQEELGLHILDVVDVRPDAGKEDYRKYTIQALNQKAEGYLFLISGREYGEILRELRSHGVEEGRRITASFSAFGQETAEIAGEALDGTYIWNKIDPYYEGEEWQELLEAYEESGHRKEQISQPVADYYDAVMAICRGYEELGINCRNFESFCQSSAVAEWFYSSEELEGIQGSYRWEEGKKLSDYQFFVYDGTVPVNLKNHAS